MMLHKYQDYLIYMGSLEERMNLDHVKTPKTIPDCLTDEQIEIVYRTISSTDSEKRNRDYMLFHILLHTGLRRKELVDLTPQDIHEDHIKVRQGKGKKDRMVYIPKDFYQELRSYIKTNDDIFNMNLNMFTKVFQRLSKRVGFHVHPHLIRHTYAVRCLRCGINIYTLQQQLGHSSLETTQVYLSLQGEQHLGEMQKFKI